MKPFNLEEYLKNPERKIITGDGRKVRVICTDKKGDYPIVALVEYCGGTHECAYSFKKDGRFYDNDSADKDLFFAPQKKQGWVNIYRDLKINELYCRYIFPSEEEAKRNATSDTITTVKIEWEE